MKKQMFIMINLILIGTIAFFLLKPEGNITGYAVKENQGFIATYNVYMNLTDMESGETLSQYIDGRDVFFAKEKLIPYDGKKLILVDETKIISDNTSCEKGEYMQKRYYYDANGNGLYDGEPYIFSVQTNEKGCVIAELPEEGYKAMLALS
ncbi:MAG: hypothetical protein KJ955_07690 [Nanoarchaeota archaeon]|nr:hypothetical protein [Nanoarchaeota archaeon]